MRIIPLETGQHVLLRRPQLTDGEAFLELVRSSRRLHYPYVVAPNTRQAFARFVANARGPRALYHMVCRREDEALVGVFNLNEIIRGPLQSAFLGYYGSAPHSGRGYMREGLGLLLRLAFQRYKLHRVEAHIQPGNRPSIAMVKKNGFRFEGTSPRLLKVSGRWRDHRRYAIDIDDWRARFA